MSPRGIVPFCAAAALLLGASSAAAQAGSAPSAPVVIADRDENIWPDPVERTYVRLSTLRNIIETFERTHGRLPETLAELSVPDPVPAWMRHDAWNNALLLSRGAGADFELRAPGPDGVPNTADDHVLRRGQEVPRSPGRHDPVRDTRITMESIQRLVRVYRERTGRLPDGIEELQPAGLRPYLSVVDAWERPIRYTRSGDEVELRSAGPDGAHGTADDVVLRGVGPS